MALARSKGLWWPSDPRFKAATRSGLKWNPGAVVVVVDDGEDGACCCCCCCCFNLSNESKAAAVTDVERPRPVWRGEKRLKNWRGLSKERSSRCDVFVGDDEDDDVIDSQLDVSEQGVDGGDDFFMLRSTTPWGSSSASRETICELGKKVLSMIFQSIFLKKYLASSAILKIFSWTYIFKYKFRTWQWRRPGLL